MNFVKKVGLLKLRNGNIAIPRIIGTVVYRSQIFSNPELSVVGMILIDDKLLLLSKTSLRHINESVNFSVGSTPFTISKTINRKQNRVVKLGIACHILNKQNDKGNLT